MNTLWLPFFPPPLVFALLALGLLSAGAAYLRTRNRGRGFALFFMLLRTSALGLVALCLLGPAREPVPQSAGEAPRIDFWVDTSASMDVEDMDGLSRLDFVKNTWLAPQFLSALERRGIALRGFAFDVNSREFPLSPEKIAELEAVGEATHITRNLVQGLSSGNPAPGALVLFSDGIDSTHAHPAPAIALARERGIPIHTVTLGGARLEPDLAVSALPLQPTLVVGETGGIHVQIFQANVGNQRITVEIDDGETVREEELWFQGEPVLGFEVPVQHDEPGTYAYSFRVQPLPREVELRNNHQTVYINVTPHRFRVLLMEGEPGWDSKFLAHALRNDPRMELLQVSQLSPTRREILSPRIPDGEAKFPATREELAAFDAVILGRSPHRVTGEAWFDLLDGFVRDQGGGLLWARGPPQAIGLPAPVAARLASLSPLSAVQGFVPEPRLTLAPEGRGHPAFEWGGVGVPDQVMPKLPPLMRAVRGTARAGARILLNLDTEGAPPALLSMPSGNGRVMLFAGEGFWQWRLLSPELDQYSPVYDLIWSALLRQLVTGEFAPGQEIDLRLSEVNLEAGSPLLIAVSRRLPAQTDEMSLQLVQPDGQRVTLSAADVSGRGTRFELELKPELPGEYRVELDTPDTEPTRLERSFNVFDLDTERIITSARPEWMRLLARETGGVVLDPREPDSLPDLLNRGLLSLEIPGKPELIWDRPSLMLLILALLGFEWILRKTKGWL
ncbi:MAG: hypothetical protein LAT83_16665 [Kiritimatiellae bacterium]|nr:hypothetical protein [Kiritimatiellia bacterium]